MSYENNSVPGLIVSFTDNTISLSGAPAIEGTYDYSILVESTNLTYNQTSSITLSGEITSSPPDLSSNLISGPQSQTVTQSNSISQVQFQFNTNYLGPLSASASDLPPGISMSFSNNIATLSGAATSSGTYNYSITALAGSSNNTVEGTIIVNEGPQYGSAAIDQYNTTGGWGAGGLTQWQSFKVGAKGKLTEVQWNMSNPMQESGPQPVEFKIYSGQGDSGTLVATSSGLTTPPYRNESGQYFGQQWVSYDLTNKNISVDVNDIYTIKITINSIDVGFLPLNIENSYTRGRASNNETWDWQFKTFVAPQTN
jgi:hypothetical protein